MFKLKLVKKYNKRQKSLLERIKKKEENLKSLNKSKAFLQKQFENVEHLSNLSVDEIIYEKEFILSKIEMIDKSIVVCKKELELVKKKFEKELDRKWF